MIKRIGNIDVFGLHASNSMDALLAELKDIRIASRIWAHDYTIWKPYPTEISNRLGWLHIAGTMKENITYMQAFAASAIDDGYTHVLLLGMGGAALAPEAFREVFGVRDSHIDLAVLDSTVPDTILSYASSLEPNRTLLIVSTKSGATVETLSLFKFFYNRIAEIVGLNEAGGHFVAITDPGSCLANLAERYGFRETFLNDPNIAGRYSALSYFGLIPAMLVGVDAEKLLDRTIAMMHSCQVDDGNSAVWLGAIISEMASIGRDKLTLILSPPITSFGSWLEQLIAESTGKEGVGILPVNGETLGEPDIYGDDRLFVYLRLAGDDTHDSALQKLIDADQPVVKIELQDLYDLGGEFFRWEMAAAIAGYRLGINPFNQPNIESAKSLAMEIVSSYIETGVLPTLTPTLQDDGIEVYTDIVADSVEDALNAFLKQARSGDYVSIQAYVQPNDDTSDALKKLRILLRDRLKLATTVGYGPRLLHCTGQMHKGDAGNGLFIQFTADDLHDLFIPDEAGSSNASISFGVLRFAQFLGDKQALLSAGRRLIHFHLGMDVCSGLERLMQIDL